MIFLLLFLTSANAAIKDIQIDLCSYGLCDTGSSVVQPASGNTANPMSADYSPSGHYVQGYAWQVFAAFGNHDPNQARTQSLEQRRDYAARLVREATYPDYTKKHEQYLEHAEFQVTWSELTPIRNELIDSKPTKPKQMFAKDYGLLAVLEADRSYMAGQVHDAHEYKAIATEFLNLTLGLDPVSGFARSSYELITGRNFVTGSHLNRFERGIAFIGVVSLGGESTVAKMVGIAGKVTHRLLKPEQIQHSIAYGRELIESQLGKVVRHVRQTGKIELEEGIKEFDTTSYIMQNAPSDGRFARILPTAIVAEVLAGKKALSLEDGAFVTAAENIFGFTPEQIVKKLWLTEKDGSWRTLKGHSLLTFELIEAKQATVSLEKHPDNIPGGLTKGGLPEWIIPSNALNEGLIKPQSIHVEEIL